MGRVKIENNKFFKKEMLTQANVHFFYFYAQ